MLCDASGKSFPAFTRQDCEEVGGNWFLADSFRNLTTVLLSVHGTHMMQRAFRMKIYPGFEEEYKRRHNEIWPELRSALRAAGIVQYDIWLDKETGQLFALIETTDSHTVDDLPNLPIMKKWWMYMSDIMETNQDNSPIVQDLHRVFRLN